jgi:hypothetical protein
MILLFDILWDERKIKSIIIADKELAKDFPEHYRLDLTCDPQEEVTRLTYEMVEEHDVTFLEVKKLVDGILRIVMKRIGGDLAEDAY